MPGRQRPTVCHVLHSLSIGGGELLARELALAHIDSFRPVFALLDELGEVGLRLRERGFHVEVLERRNGVDFRCVSRLRRFLGAEQVCLIQAHQYGPLFYSALARWPRSGPAILFHEHGRDYPDCRRKKRVWANRILLHRSDQFVAVGTAVRQALIEFEGMAPDRIEVIYNGIELGRYDPMRRRRATVRADEAWADDEIVIIQVARLNRLKDHETALRAIRILRDQCPKARLVLIGEGEERAKIERLRIELGLEDCVELLGTRLDVPRLLEGADIFLLSSLSEGIPLTLMEAMACGLPCVATRVGGVPEVVEHGVTGLLGKAGDPEVLEAHLRQLVIEPELRQRFGIAGRRRVERRFDASTMVQRFGSLYRRMARLDLGPGSTSNIG